MTKATTKLILYFLSVSLVITGCKKDDDPEDIPLIPPDPTSLQSYSFQLGNLEKGALDTFFLEYNKPVTIKYIRLLSSYCLPDIKFQSFKNGTAIKFYGLRCGTLGDDFSFEVNATTALGIPLTDTVTFSYYQRKFTTEGQLMHYLITPDNKKVWVCTNAPDRIYEFSLEDTSYLKVFNVPFRPWRIVLNPFNSKFYVLNYPYHQTDLDKIFVMDPLTGNIERTVTVKKDAYDDPQKNINIYDLGFGASGYGIVNTGTKEYSSTARWRIIDSRFNDTIYAHTQWLASIGGGNQPYAFIEGVFPNYNHSKIYLPMPYGQPRAGVMDVKTGVVTMLIYPNTNPNHYIVPNKVSDLLFVGSYAYQQIIGTGAPGNYSSFDNRFSETADFSYRNGESNIVYYRGKEYSYNFNILDYNQARTVFKTNVSPDFNRIQATTDGKYILARIRNVLTLFETEWFYKNF